MLFIKRIAFYLILLTIISKILGFFRDIVLAYYYGASSISDVYIISLTIPGTLFAFIGIAISTSFVPIYSSLMKEKSVLVANKYLNNLISFLFVICTLLIGILLIFTENIIKIFAFGFDYETLKLAILFTRITAFGIYFSIVINIYIVFLNVRNVYLGPAFTGVPFNISIIISIIVSSQTNILVLPFGLLFSLLIQFLYLKYFLKKVNYRYSFQVDFRNSSLQKTLILSLPVILGVSINQINIIVDRTLASYLEVGGIAAINYSSKINEFAMGIFVISLLSFIYPRMVNLVQDNKNEKLVTELQRLLKIINLLIIPISLFGIVFSYEIVSLLYGRGAFNEGAINITSSLLKFYLIGLIAMSYREVLTKVFFAFQDTRTPTYNAALALVLNIILNLLFSRIMGITGLALATSISTFLTVILLSNSLKRRLPNYYLKNIFKHFIQIILITTVPLLIVKIIYSFFFANQFGLVFAGISYLFLLLLFYKIFKVKELTILIDLIKSKINKKK